MEWSRLKSMKCPKCNAVLIDVDNFGVFRCSGCSFRIKEERFNEIVKDLYKAKSYSGIMETDNQEALNNL